MTIDNEVYRTNSPCIPMNGAGATSPEEGGVGGHVRMPARAPATPSPATTNSNRCPLHQFGVQSKMCQQTLNNIKE